MMRSIGLWIRPLFVACVVLVANVSFGQTNNSYPMLMSLRPTAAQIGQSTDHELNARYNLAGASHVIVSGTGVTGEILPNDQEKPEDKSKNDVMASKCKIRFHVAPDALPGVRDFRVFTPHGTSTLGQLAIARDPIVSESVDNDTIDKAQLVPIPSAMCGAIEKAEDVDFYKFQVESGTSITFHMRSQRLMNRLHDMQTRIDPMITLKTEGGSVIASSDNYYSGDPLLHHRFESAGVYVLEVRDVRYQGNYDWTYVVEANTRPFVTQAIPLAGNAGQSNPVSFVGFNIANTSLQPVPFPASSSTELQWVSTSIDGQWTNEFPVVTTTAPVILEQVAAPNSAAVATDGTTAKGIANAQPVTIPSTIAGRIDSANEMDRYVFDCKAQDRFSFEVIARRANSGLDPKIRIVNEAGGVLIENDDATFSRIVNADSMIENWTAPADGKYILEIRDLHQRGGPQFTYAISTTRSQPYFLLEADTDKTELAPGMSSVIYVRAQRRNGYTGSVQLAVQGLPAGVTAVAGTIQPDSLDGCIVLQAAPDAPLGQSNITVSGTASHPIPNAEPLSLSAQALPMQEYYLPGGGRGNYPVAMHTLSVSNPMDLRSIQSSLTEIELKPGESKRFDVTIERAPDFKGNVTLDVLLQHLEQPYGNPLPKGVTVDVGASKTLLTAGETTGFITLKAAVDAKPVERHLVALNAHVSINFVMKHTLCGPPLFISVK